MLLIYKKTAYDFALKVIQNYLCDLYDNIIMKQCTTNIDILKQNPNITVLVMSDALNDFDGARCKVLVCPVDRGSYQDNNTLCCHWGFHQALIVPGLRKRFLYGKKTCQEYELTTNMNLNQLVSAKVVQCAEDSFWRPFLLANKIPIKGLKDPVHEFKKFSSAEGFCIENVLEDDNDEFAVYSAQYGNNETFVDVTDKVQGIKSSHFLVSNETFGCDPLPMVVKELKITFMDGSCKTYTEGEYVERGKGSCINMGFIVLRHANDQTSARYWELCVERIRLHHPQAPIVIIDDHSEEGLIDEELQASYDNMLVINSTYPRGRGELLPYLYFVQHQWFETAVYIHDSVFLNRRIEWTTDEIMPLWHFTHDWNMPEKELAIIKKISHPEVVENIFHQHQLWNGFFGGMCMMNVNFIKRVHRRHNLENLVEHIYNREMRMVFERIISCICTANMIKKMQKKSFMGDIHKYCSFGLTYEQRLETAHLPMSKIWSGR